MTRARAGEKRLANEIMAEYYRQRASAGLMITEATVISPQANGWQNTPGIYTDEQAQAWQMVTKIAQRKGTPIFSNKSAVAFAVPPVAIKSSTIKTL